ncbi:MAG: FAD-binding oxidoreductase, partial [Armatimonadota bacterium]|nr:FAD-binding oxidoreductase [Armatimonadota bacterium]
MTVQAGMTVAQLQKILGDQKQFLPVDIACPERQTIGGMIAARADSLRRFGFGSVRDALIGVTVINARGELVKGGGKVVKNVAGYDLPKLYCGSWGTLGLIIEASFKVSPIPATSATVVLPLDAEHNSEDVLDGILGSDIQPSFVALLNPGAAQAVLEREGSAQYLIVGFDGAVEAVEWQVKALGGIDGRLDSEEARETRVRLCDFSLRPASMTAAFHILSSQVGAFSRMVEWTARRSGFSAQVLA